MLLQETAGAAHPLAGTFAEWIWLVPVLPFVGFIINGLLSLRAAVRMGPADPSAYHAHGEGHAHAEAGHAGHGGHGDHGDDAHAGARHPYAGLVSIVGPLVLGLSFAVALGVFVVLSGAHAEAPFVRNFFPWIVTGDLTVHAALQVDQLSMVMTLVVTGVGFLIHVFSVGYMQDDPGYPRYFAYLNLFIFFMLVLVLGASYPVLFVGWEGVGLCSYLLIGYWYQDKANADAGKKAFIVNRIGDFGFLIAMFLLFANLGTLDFTGVAGRAAELGAGSALVTAIALFFFLGCTGKSAQIPLYTWLPDAMAGPTPVSALIHAATMVTAGVYLVARSAAIFALAPSASLTVAVIGAVTALFAATIGLKQWDIKKVLAYSTVSQLGYMFVGVGVGAYTAGIFHLVTHAFFKALLFLGSGSVIFAMHRAFHHTGSHEDAQDMRNMGGLRQHMPVTFALMWIATLAIAGIPPLAGFFSKDEILASVFARTHGSTLADASWLGIPGSVMLYLVYAMALGAAFLTAIYMTRMMLYTFHGPNRTGERERPHLAEAPWVMTGPLVVLGVLTVVGGALNLPAFLGATGTQILHHWLEPVTGAPELAITHGEAAHLALGTELALVALAIAVALGGMVLAFARLRPERLVPRAQAPEATGIERVLEHKYYVDELYDRTIVRPTLGLSRAVLWRGMDAGLIDGLFVNGSAWLMRGLGWIGARLQTGLVSTYAWVLVLGVIAVLGAFSLR
ncbi:MAG TPA: NADH-quinone oxidoreductase subunit L [Gemmatimonadaceae bacterium]|nr:NADH-quinone oxidoreductase subunit L [Gemmatimonadaceae bacterium]